MKRPNRHIQRGFPEFAALAFLFLLVLAFFAPVLFGGSTLLPFDNLYRFPPWQQFAQTLGVGQPHNPLLDDLVLENYPWKKFIADSLSLGELPLWNPYILSGQPFMAAGQNAALYPLGVLFLILPLARAYGIFVALHFWIAAAAMYLLARVLRLRPFAAAVSAIVYAFSGFMVVSVVFPMIVSAAAWLPAILAAAELTVREETKRLESDPKYSLTRELLFALVCAILLGLQFLAGHIEISYYILLVMGFYCLWRGIGISGGRVRMTNPETAATPVHSLTRSRWWWSILDRLPALGLIIAVLSLGFGLALVQLLPLYELVQRNFRVGSVSYDQVAGWALPLRQVVTFFIPDFFGNPTHHSYLDVFDWTTKAAPTGTIFWGVKNYVEAGSYVGILPLVLAVVAIAFTFFEYVRRFRPSASPANTPTYPETAPFITPHQSVTPLFTALAVLSLLFAFGTPLYAILFYGLPGYNQLHTAFRWILPYTLSIAFLAGAGAEALTGTRGRHNEAVLRRVPPPGTESKDARPAVDAPVTARPAIRFLALMLITAGLALPGILVISLFWRAPFIALADQFVARSDLARPVFQTGQAFWSYEFRNLLILGIFLAAAGAIIRLAQTQIYLPVRLGGSPLWQPLAVAVVVLDLFVLGAGFNPSSDPRLVGFTPPSIQFLQNDHSLFRITSYDSPGGKATGESAGAQADLPPERVLNPNAGMYYGLSDIRGYDSIIPKQYAEFMSAIAPQDELLYNRIAPFYDYKPLSSPLLNLLNVKYVLSTRPLPNPGYRLVYDDEIKIYENQRVLPRAFLVSGPNATRVIPDRSQLLGILTTIDPQNQVLFEEPPSSPPVTKGAQKEAASSEGQGAVLPVPTIDRYSGNQVDITVDTPQSAYLVLTDSYFPGWVAQIDGGDTPIYRADYNFRAITMPAGKHTVRFRYSPLSLKVGAVGSLVAGLVVLLGLAALGWRRISPAPHNAEGSQARVIAKNSLLPMLASFLNQGLNLGLALITLRVLGPTNAGRYAFAVAVWFFLNSITDFGLGILMTREVSRDRSLANRYLANTALLRSLLTAVSIIPLALFVASFVAFANLTMDTVAAIALLWVSLIPANLAGSLSYLFNAYERFEYPTAVGVATTMVAVSLQVAALLAGFGIVGLAAVSIITNVFTLLVLYYLVRTTLFKPRWEFDLPLLRWMFFESYPLMLNNLLANLFFRIDVFLLKPLTSDAVVGYYTTAYKFINALNFIPANFTLAIFPLLSRYSASAKDAMARALVLSLKLLLWISVPITIATVFISRELILFYGGSAYLPDSEIALQWLIWFLPFSFVNGVVHYVLIALNQQRFLTKAFIIGVVFNIVANLVAIPLLSYRGAALVTVLSEMALLIPFYYSLRRHLGPLPVFDLMWRPVAAAGAMAVSLYLLLPHFHLFIALAAASLLYGVVLLGLGAMGPDEWLVVGRFLPPRLQPVISVFSRSPAK